MPRSLPSGQVTFLFTDVEGSTRTLERVGPASYAELLSQHHRVCRRAWSAHHGVEVDTAGDAFFVAFARPGDALAAAAAAQKSLAGIGLSVRMGIHSGEAMVAETGYVGLEVHRAARIAAAGHGGQVLVSAATTALLGPGERSALRDLGDHRFKDIDALERVYQLGETTFPPIRSLYRSSLPTPAAPLVGRTAELAAIGALLEADAGSVVTLVGPGGIGKTRLALQAAATVQSEFADGVWWVPLASVTDPGHWLSEVARSLGLDEPGADVRALLTRRLAGSRALIVIDNVEQLLPDLAAGLAALTAEWATVRCLVTSRERLRIAGEAAYVVPELALDDATAMFVERAAAAGVPLAPDSVVAELCLRLDRLPLALELAAARTPLLDPATLLEQLGRRLDLPGGRDADPRQATLRATIDWSYALLSDRERAVLRALAVLPGGATLLTAEHVARADPEDLQQLVDKSLLRRRPGTSRFRMLETVRDYALERLAADGPADVDERLAKHLVDIGQPVAWAPEGLPKLEACRVLEPELPNVAAAMTWALEHHPALAVELAATWWPCWMTRGELRRGTAWLDAAAPFTVNHTAAQVAVLAGVAAFALLAGDADRLEDAARQEVAAAKEVLPAALAYALRDLGNAYAQRTRYEEAEEAYRSSLDATPEAQVSARAGTLLNLGLVAQAKGDVSGAHALFEQALAARPPDERIVHDLHHDLALLLIRGKHLDEARAHLLAALRIAERHAWSESLVNGLGAVSVWAAAVGRVTDGRSLAGTAQRLGEALGAPPWDPRDDDPLVRRAVQLAAAAERPILDWEEGLALAIRLLDAPEQDGAVMPHAITLDSPGMLDAS